MDKLVTRSYTIEQVNDALTDLREGPYSRAFHHPLLARMSQQGHGLRRAERARRARS